MRPEGTERTFVASVLFVDIVGYSKEPVERQLAWRTRFAEQLASTLKDVPPDERVVVDAGDGAAVCFLGDPECAIACACALVDALARDSAPGERHLRVRVGINIGPLKLHRDVNGNPGVVGDAINVAARVMAFAGEGEILASQSYRDTIACLSERHARMFTAAGARSDKHGREHSLYRLQRDAQPENAPSGPADDAHVPRAPDAHSDTPLPQKVRFCSGSNGRSLAYAAVGEGPPFVCAAWWVSHLEEDWATPEFRQYFTALARGYTLIRYDRNGVGLSDRERTDFTLESEVRDLERVLDHLGHDRSVLYGQSFGGAIAIDFAARHPERVERLVLYGSYARGSTLAPPQVREALTALARSTWGLGSQMMGDIFVPGVSPEQVQRVVTMQRRACDREVGTRLLQMTYEVDVAASAARIRAPTLVLNRRGDRATSLTAARELAALIPGAEFAVVDGDVHLPWYGDSAAIAERVQRFLRE